jgi:Na+-transporting methylmalonyl-CoA/oxaloacetate decarboxylase gamma subunit
MQTDQYQNLYETVLRYASLPVLLLIILLCWLITNFLMSMRWQQGRRSKQIKKAVAARQARLAAVMAAKEQAAADKSEEPPS